MIRKFQLKDGEKFCFEGHINEFLLKRENAEKTEIFTVVIPIGGKTHDQIHNDVEQTFVILEGKGKVFSICAQNTQVENVSKGDIVFIPHDTPHLVENSSSEQDLKYICINSFLDNSRNEPKSIIHAENVLIHNEMCANELNERPVLVAGSNGFVGKAITRELCNRGKYVVCMDSSYDMEKEGDVGRISRYSNLETEMYTILKKHKEKKNVIPSVLICCIGDNSIHKHSFRMTEEEFKKQVDGNLVEVFKAVNDYALICSENDMTGSIIVLGSIGGKRSHREMCAYDSSKAGLEGLCRSLALDYAPYGINVNVIEVGPIEDSRSSKQDGELTAKLRALVPIGKYPTVCEVARIICDMALNSSIYVTGQTISIDGGMTVQLRPLFCERVLDKKMYLNEL